MWLSHFKLSDFHTLKTNWLLLNWNSGKSSLQRMTKNMFFDWSILPSGVETMFLLSSICRVELGPFLVNLFSIDFLSLHFFILDTVKTVFGELPTKLRKCVFFSRSLARSMFKNWWNVNWKSPYYVVVAVVEFLTRVPDLCAFFILGIFWG